MHVSVDGLCRYGPCPDQFTCRIGGECGVCSDIRCLAAYGSDSVTAPNVPFSQRLAIIATSARSTETPEAVCLGTFRMQYLTPGPAPELLEYGIGLGVVSSTWRAGSAPAGSSGNNARGCLWRACRAIRPPSRRLPGCSCRGCVSRERYSAGSETFPVICGGRGWSRQRISGCSCTGTCIRT